LSWQDALARHEDRHCRTADEVHEQRADPQLAELEPRRPAAPLEARDGDEEVLREELRLADDDEDEADPEREPATAPAASAKATTPKATSKPPTSAVAASSSTGRASRLRPSSRARA
jgi:hypothetical protein